VLLPWFVIGALSKAGGLSMSIGPTVGGIPLSLGAYFAYAPERVGDLSGGLPQFTFLTQAYVSVMVAAELVLPVLIVLGLGARLAAWVLALHQVLFLLTTRPTAEAGAAFDANPFDMLPDQILLWAMLIAPIALFGAGPLSAQALVARWRGRRG
jgi:putative oxidoreductase